MDKISDTTKRLQAANTLLGYLQANGLSAQMDGERVSVGNISLTVGNGYSEVSKQVDVSDLRSNKDQNISKALNAVGSYLNHPQTLIYKRPNHSGSKRGKISNNFEPVLFREKTFQNTPNPSNAKIKKWAPVAYKHARTAWYRYARHLLSFGYEKEDLESISLVHLTTFLHRYATGDDDRDNKNLHRFMKQRMLEAAAKIKRKATMCSCDFSQRIDLVT